MGSADAVTWLVFVYQLPAKAAALKATVRRQLSGVGAVYLSRACAVAPSSGPAERMMRRMRATIADAGGSGVVLRAQAMDGEPEMTAAFNAALDREYGDIIRGCRAAVDSIAALTAAGDFRYDELWDKDKELRLLTGRYQAIREHDVLGAVLPADADAALCGYRAALDGYASRVYATDSA